MAGTVKIPVIGTVKSKTAAIGAAAIVAVVAIVIIRRRNSAAAASSLSSSATNVTDPAGNVCAALNPQTGFCPGTVQDQQALASDQFNSGLNAGGTGPGGTGPGGAPTFATNGEWAQSVEQYLGSSGADAKAAAIAKYLNGQPITPAQVITVEEAEAAYGPPPVAGTGGFPPSYHTEAPGKKPPTGTGWYWHSDTRTFSNDGKTASHASGSATINGTAYYWHADKRYFTLRNKRASPASGAVTW